MISVTSSKYFARQGGFTLVEIMITVAIVAILASIALPAYNSYIVKSEIRSAQADLQALALAFENRLQRTLAYPVVPDDKKGTTAGIESVFTTWKAATSNFNFKVEVTTATTYTIVAEGSGRQGSCKVTLTHANTRTTANCKYITNGNWL